LKPRFLLFSESLSPIIYWWIYVWAKYQTIISSRTLADILNRSKNKRVLETQRVFAKNAG